MKATVSIYSLTTWTPVTVSLANLLPQVGRTERKTFPSNEAIAFENELQKRNFELTLVVKITPAESQPELVAYVGIARMKGTALLHKMCVVKNFRCQGIATKVLLMRCEQLRLQGCNIIQLWVDESREPAKQLYGKLGFKLCQKIENYYASGRNGIRMTLQLQ